MTTETSSSAPTYENTSAVVVLFHPAEGFCVALRRVQDQVRQLVVVANDRGGSARLGEMDPLKLTYLEMPTNAGLGAALNQGLRHAAATGSRWCLLLDQDTVVDAGLLSGLRAVFDSYPMSQRVGLLVPNYRSRGGARLGLPTAQEWQEVRAAVTSGSLVNMPALRDIGEMREDFFIEGIDTEFCLRLRASGWKIVGSGESLMVHGAGDAQERRLFGRTVLVSHHPAWRCHLQMRNLFWTLARWGSTDVRWTLATFSAVAKRLVLIALFETHRCAKLWAMAKGAAEGCWFGLWRAPLPSVSAARRAQESGLFAKRG